MSDDMSVEAVQQAFLDNLAVGDRVRHANDLSLVGTVVSTWDRAEIGDVRVQWDAPLPWLIGGSLVDRWHSPGFLRPADELLPPYERARLQLVAAERLLDDEERWTKNVMARNDAGDYVDPLRSRCGCRWCLIGAMCYVAQLSHAAAIETPAVECLATAMVDRIVEHGQPYGDDMPKLGDWNDRESTTCTGAVCSAICAMRWGSPRPIGDMAAATPS